MRRHAVWLVTLPVSLAGIEAAHALANLAFGAPHAEIFATDRTGAGLLPLIAALALATVLCSLAGRVAGLWWTPRSSRAVALPFLLLPPVAFVLLELGEALAASEPSWSELHEPTFLAGLALQLPVALVGYLLARALLRLSDDLRERVLGRQPQDAPEATLLPARPADDRVRLLHLLASSLARAPPGGSLASG